MLSGALGASNGCSRLSLVSGSVFSWYPKINFSTESYMVRNKAIGMLLIFGAFTQQAYGAGIDEKISQVMASVETECSGYADTIVDVQWEVFKDRAEEQGRVLSIDQRESLRYLQMFQCMTVKKIQLLEVVRGSIHESEWLKMGGAETIERLKGELRKTL